jgi:S-adenosylmethionine:tRNA ribosyltransferase-isomerase
MKTEEFNYDLDTAFIAQRPVFPRHNAKLLHIDREKSTINDGTVWDLTTLLTENDVLVFNDSKVFSARIHGTKEGGTADIEILFLKNIINSTWECLLKPAKRLKVGDSIRVPGNHLIVLLEKREDGVCVVDVGLSHNDWIGVLDEWGHMPLPPYIKAPLEDKSEYQTVYAREHGSSAAPTAGLHFTEELLDELKRRNIGMEFVTLHVGLDTFQPVKVEEIQNHAMHSEFYCIDAITADRLLRYKKEGKRIIAVGTTAVRVLESWAQTDYTLHSNWTNLFIYPGYTYRFVDSIITNFHLPKSTLVMMISAFSGKELLFKAYEHAKKHNYRFYSFGDAMWIE